LRRLESPMIWKVLEIRSTALVLGRERTSDLTLPGLIQVTWHDSPSLMMVVVFDMGLVA